MSGESMPALILAQSTQERMDRLVESDMRDRLRDGLKTLFDTISTRVDAIDKASEVLAENVNRVPTLLDREVGRLREMFEARVVAIEHANKVMRDHFHELIDQNDLRYQQRFDASEKALAAASLATEKAVNAALAAAKEGVAQQNDANAASISKSEANVTKQIDSIVALVTAMEKTLNDKITGINSRLDRGDGSSGAKSAGQANLLAISALVVAVIAIGATFLHQPAPVLTAPAVVPLAH